MTTNTEAAKQRYARELAAYTLQQWNVARERELERESERKKADKSQPRRNPQPQSSSENIPPGTDGDDAVAVAAKVVDFAMRTAPQQNGDT